MSLAVRSKPRALATHWLALCLASAALGCDPNFSPDWHAVSPEEAGEPPVPPEAGQPPIDVGSDAGPNDASAPLEPDPDAAPVPSYNCRIEYCDAGIPGCRTVCFAPAREVHCRPPLEFCPWFGADAVDCNLCMTPPIK